MGSHGYGCRLLEKTPGSPMKNPIHGYWRSLPNFNPYTITSNPGQNLADEAASVLMGGHGHGASALVHVLFLSWIDAN